MVRPSLTLLALCLFAAQTASPCLAQGPAQSAAAKECLRLDAKPADSIPWDEHERVYKQWVDACRQAMTTNSGDIRIKKGMARALGATGERAEEIVLLREMAAKNDADALFEIYDMYKSYFRSDVNKPQLVKRAEAEQALRKAAELGLQPPVSSRNWALPSGTCQSVTPLPQMRAVTPGIKRRNTTAPLPTTTRRSDLIQNMPKLTKGAETLGKIKASSTAPSPTITRRSELIRNMVILTTVVAARIFTKGILPRRRLTC